MIKFRFLFIIYVFQFLGFTSEQKEIEIELVDRGDVVVMTEYIETEDQYKVKIKDDEIYIHQGSNNPKLIGPFTKDKTQSQYLYKYEKHEYLIKIRYDKWFLYINKKEHDLNFEALTEHNLKKNDPIAQYHKAMDYWMMERNDAGVIKSIKLFRKSARGGHLHAQIKLADMYYAGDTVKKNLKECFKWRLMAAKQGDSSSQFIVSSMYYRGEGVDMNDKLCFEWAQKGALNHSDNAEFFMGLFYHDGVGVKKDYKKSKEYLLKAKKKGNLGGKTFLDALEGDFLSIFKISALYSNGQILRPSEVKAYAWKKAGFKFRGHDTKKSLMLIESAKHMKEEDVKEAEALGDEYYKIMKERSDSKN